MEEQKNDQEQLEEIQETPVPTEEKETEPEEVEGYISAINIGSKVDMIGISGEFDSDYTIYSADKNTIPVYELKLGDKVRAHVLNGKITTLTIRKAFEHNSFMGYVTSKKSDFIVIEYYDGEVIKSKRVYCNDDTVMVSGISGKSVKFSAFDKDTRVFVVLGSDDKTAKRITLIENI